MENKQEAVKWTQQEKVQYLIDEIKRAGEAIKDAEKTKTELESEQKMAKNRVKLAELRVAILIGKSYVGRLQKRLLVEK